MRFDENTDRRTEKLHRFRHRVDRRIGRLLHVEGEETYRLNASGQPIDDWGDVIFPDRNPEYDGPEGIFTDYQGPDPLDHFVQREQYDSPFDEATA